MATAIAAAPRYRQRGAQLVICSRALFCAFCSRRVNDPWHLPHVRARLARDEHLFHGGPSYDARLLSCGVRWPSDGNLLLSYGFRRVVALPQFVGLDNILFAVH